MDFFSNSIVICHQKIAYFFFNMIFCTESLWQRLVLFVTLSHCNKQFFYLLHLVTATNNFFVSRTESLQQTKYVAKKKCKKIRKNTTKKCITCFKRHTKCEKQKGQSNKNAAFLAVFGIFFLGNIQILFVTMTQCNKQKCVCLNDSVWQTKQIFVAMTQCYKQHWFKKKLFVACDKGIEEEEKNPFKCEFHHHYQIALGYFCYT